MYKRGFTIFFAVLVSSLALAIGLAIYDLLVRELELTQTATQSQYAIYAADTGAECALYWDSKYNGSDSAFATSTDSAVLSSGVTCSGQDVAAVGTPPDPFSLPPSGWNPWDVDQTGTSATTEFWVVLTGVSGNPCAWVTVQKTTTNPGDPPATVITSRGRNTCESGAPLQIERTLQATY